MGIFDLLRPNVEKLASKGDVKGLLRALKNKDYLIRDEARSALVKLGEPAVEPLIQVLENDFSGVQEGAALALGEIGDPRAGVPLIQAFLRCQHWGHPRFHVGNCAKTALEELEGARAVGPFIRALKHEDRGVRVYAVNALFKIVHIGDTQAVEALIQALRDALKDEDRYVRMRAPIALGVIRNTKAVDALIQTLQDEYGAVREDAIWALGNIGDTQAVDALIQALKDDDNGSVRVAAVKALGEIGDAKAVEALIAALKDEDTCVQCESAIILVRIGDAKALEAIRLAFKDKINHVPDSVAVAFAKQGEAWVLIPLIEDTIYNPYDHIRYEAEDAIKMIDIVKGVESFVQAFKHKDPLVRDRVAEILMEIGNEKVVERLIQALKDEDKWVRFYAAKALGRIGDAKAVEPLIQAAKDQDLDVRSASERALEIIRSKGIKK